MKYAIIYNSREQLQNIYNYFNCKADTFDRCNIPNYDLYKNPHCIYINPADIPVLVAGNWDYAVECSAHLISYENWAAISLEGEEKWRPFKTIEELMPHLGQKKILNYKDDSGNRIYLDSMATRESKSILHIGSYTAKNLLDFWKFEDGTPFGVKESSQKKYVVKVENEEQGQAIFENKPYIGTAFYIRTVNWNEPFAGTAPLKADISFYQKNYPDVLIIPYKDYAHIKDLPLFEVEKKAKPSKLGNLDVLYNEDNKVTKVGCIAINEYFRNTLKNDIKRWIAPQIMKIFDKHIFIGDDKRAYHQGMGYVTQDELKEIFCEE